MIKAADLDGVKLVFDEKYFATEEQVQLALEQAFTQGSQGWGVKREAAVLLVMARELRDSLELSTTAEENARLLKGAQMSGGRLKKQVEGLQAKLETQAALMLAQTVALDKLTGEYEALDAQCVKIKAAYDDAEAEVDATKEQLARVRADLIQEGLDKQ